MLYAYTVILSYISNLVARQVRLKKGDLLGLFMEIDATGTMMFLSRIRNGVVILDSRTYLAAIPSCI